MKKGRGLILLVLAMILAFSVPAFAENIESVELIFEGELPKAGQRVSDNYNVYPGGGGYRIVSTSYIQNEGTWRAGDRPTIYVELAANGNGIFTRSDSGYFRIRGMSAKYAYALVDFENDPQTLSMSVELPVITGGKNLDPPENLYWSGNSAKWNSVPDAGKYEVRLYRNGNSLGTVASNKASYNFTDKLTSEGWYYFQVRAESGSSKGEWSYESEDLYVSTEQAKKNKGQNTPVTPTGKVTYSQYWRTDGAGLWHVYDRYGNLVTNCWLCDDAVASNGKNIWYLIDAGGNMVSAGLVRDAYGNYYSLETNHNGYYGMMRYTPGTYNAVYLNLEQSHNGRFGAINNQDAISVLNSMYGTTDISGISTRLVYTSQF